MKKNNAKQDYRFQLLEGIVDTAGGDYIKVTFGSYHLPYVLLGLSRYRTIIFQVFQGEKPWYKTERDAMSKIKAEVRFQILERPGRDPWKAIIDLCDLETACSKVSYQWCPAEDSPAGAPFERKIARKSKIKIAQPDGTDRIDRAKLYFNVGRSHLHEEDYDAALTAFDHAIDIDPSQADYYIFRGIALRNLNKLDLAIADCNQAIEMEPKNAFAYSMRGYCYYFQDAHEAALADCNKALELEPETAAYWVNRGYVEANKGDFTKAVIDFDKAIEIRPGEPDYYDNKARALLELEKPELAMAVYEEILQIDPGNIDAFSMLAQLKPAQESIHFREQTT